MMLSPSLLSLLIAAQSASVPRAECFPLERLAPAERAEAEALLLKILDNEGLYTVVGGIKPISSGWLTIRFPVDRPASDAMERWRRILATFRCGDELFANLQPFWRIYEDQRTLDGVIFRRSRVADTVRERASLFGPFGVSPGSHPIEVVMAIEVDATPRRSRAYGHLFGYPPAAVDFFVAAETEMRHTKQFVVRDFRHVPVYSGSQNRFVYAVPKGSEETDADRALRARCAPILAAYQARRDKYIGPGKPGVAALIRDWFDDGRGRCHPDHALAMTKADISDK
jgi:hypothetical protein